MSLLLRLPPPTVSHTPEVRCAVVGNVDSGKSTTLGVLTRGACYLRLERLGVIHVLHQAYWTMVEGAHEYVFSVTSTKLRQDGHPVSAWK
jgi:hypothetical protein